jgi:glutaminase
MHTPVEIDEVTGPAFVSTGHLPPAERVDKLLAEAYEQFKTVDEGKVADYIPALARTPRNLFGLCVVETNGAVHTAGDTEYQFSIQSISKSFVFALVCQAIGAEPARERIGVNSTGLPFNSVMAIELNPHRTMNPLVRCRGDRNDESRARRDCRREMGLHPGRVVPFRGSSPRDRRGGVPVGGSPNFRNRGIAKLLEGYGRMYFDALEATDVYTKQCSLSVTVKDLAVMGATLADGGVNPVTAERVIDAPHCKRVLAALATSGLYELSGDWLYEIGLPGKSGVSGGIVTISPGKGGLGTFAPLLDTAGNSIKGQRATKFLSERLGMNLFSSLPDH